MTAEPVRRTDRGAAAIELLSTLYPPPLAVSVGRVDARDARAVWTAVPSAEQPRLLLPGGRPSAATRVLRRQLTGQRLRTRVARTGLTLASGSGVLSRLPGLRVSVAGPSGAPSIEDPLRDLLDVADLRVAMPIGPARSNRKPVLQVTDSRGRVLAFAKVGHTSLTKALVRRESEALSTLAGDPVLGVRSPRLLGLLSWSGYDVLVIEPLDIPARRLSGDAARRRLLELVAAVAEVGGRSTVRWAEHPHRARLLERLADCGELAACLRGELARIDPETQTPTGSWHGDLNSGNLALVADACPVWDWERFESGVPVGFDLLHHDLHQSITVAGVPAAAAASRLLCGAARLLAPLGVGLDAAEAVARAYLVTLACRYLADDQAAAGADLGDVGAWLLPALGAGRS
jgi:hypothetical protein